ncbi:MAG: cytochrome P450 [Candidatus Brocadiae bacterium]|nr:cytochrome P450 [Candidatus Brocadiia bacterium]
MPATSWPGRILEQLRGVNPFGGDSLPSRVPVFASGRPTLPFPHPWNYREPIRIFETFWCGAEKETGAGRHNRYLYVGGFPPVLLSRDPAIIKAVLGATGEKPGQFDRDTAPTAGIARATGEDSLLYANGAVWRRQKSLAAEPFSRSSLFQPEQFHGFEQTFRRTVAERLEVLRARQKATGQTVTRLALEPEIKVVMLEMLVNNFFGGTVDERELRERFVPSLDGLIAHMVSDTIAPRMMAVAGLLTGRRGLLKRRKADFEALVDIALAGRAKGLGLWQQFHSEAPDAALRSNLRVFLAGAMEATSSFASWAISHLARRPDIQEQIFAEVKDLETYDPDSLTHALALNRVLEETVRLTPALYFLPRRATVDTWIETTDHRRMLIPKGAHVCLDVWHANRCEEFWGAAVTGYPAGDFAPERWEFLARKGLTPKDMLHFGFGYGPRFCPGRFLGLLEVGLVVGAMVKLFRFTAVGEPAGVRAGVSTKPADGVLVDLELRA